VRFYFSGPALCSLSYLIPLFHGLGGFLTLGSGVHQIDSHWVSYVGGSGLFLSSSVRRATRWQLTFSVSLLVLLLLPTLF